MTNPSSAAMDAERAPGRGPRAALLAALRYAVNLAVFVLVVAAVVAPRPAQARLLLTGLVMFGLLRTALRRTGRPRSLSRGTHR
jgi:hypothetical protein